MARVLSVQLYPHVFVLNTRITPHTQTHLHTHTQTFIEKEGVGWGWGWESPWRQLCSHCGIAVCHKDILRCLHWRQSWHHDNSRFSMHPYDDHSVVYLPLFVDSRNTVTLFTRGKPDALHEDVTFASSSSRNSGWSLPNETTGGSEWNQNITTVKPVYNDHL